MYRFLEPVQKPNLPDPSKESTPEKAALVKNVNNFLSNSDCKTPKRKRGDYNFYSPEIRADIGKKACENGVANTAKKFSKSLGKNVNESTVRIIRKAYLRAKSKALQNEISKLPKKEAGRPLLLGKYDDDVVDYVKKLREAGGVVNTAIVIGIAKGVLTHHDKFLLRENGGSIELSRTWGQSFMRRIEFSKRKGTKTVKTIPSDFEVKLKDFHKRIADAVIHLFTIFPMNLL